MSQSNLYYLPCTELKFILSNLNNADIEDGDRMVIDSFAQCTLCLWDEPTLASNSNKLMKLCFPSKVFNDRLRPQVHSTLLALAINHLVHLRQHDVRFVSRFQPHRLHADYCAVLEVNFAQEPNMVLMLTRFEAALHIALSVLSISPHNKKGVLMTASAMLADHHRPYNSGGSPTRPTRNCLAIFQQLTGIPPIKKVYSQSKISKRTVSDLSFASGDTVEEHLPVRRRTSKDHADICTFSSSCNSSVRGSESSYTSEEDLSSLDPFSTTPFSNFTWPAGGIAAEEDFLLDLFDDQFDEFFSASPAAATITNNNTTF